MIIVMRGGCPSSAVDEVAKRLEDIGYAIHKSEGVERTVIGAVGGEEYAKVDALEQIRALEWVEDVILITKPYKFVAREYRGGKYPVDIGKGVVIGGEEVIMMAGPCTVESEAQLFKAAKAVAATGAKVLRGGAYKPSTSPYSFQGMGEEGLVLLAEAGKQFNMAVVTEVMDPRKVELVSQYADILQVGTRNMQNYDLLREVGQSRTPVLLKRGMTAKYEEWLLAAEYIACGGNERILLCERGLRTFETSTRNTLDLAAIPIVQRLSHLPVIIDPSQGTGRRDLVAPMSKAAVAAGADGLIVEVHPNPDQAIKDGPQSQTIEQFEQMMPELRRIAEAVGRTFGRDPVPS